MHLRRTIFSTHFEELGMIVFLLCNTFAVLSTQTDGHDLQQNTKCQQSGNNP